MVKIIRSDMGEGRGEREVLDKEGHHGLPPGLVQGCEGTIMQKEGKGGFGNKGPSRTTKPVNMGHCRCTAPPEVAGFGSRMNTSRPFHSDTFSGVPVTLSGHFTGVRG